VEGLADKVVLITGGSSGIGEACARRLAAEGCAIMVAGRDAAKTRAVAECLLPEGKHGWVTGDVREVGDCRALVTAVMERYGQLDVLVHCAGVWDERPTLDVSEAAGTQSSTRVSRAPSSRCRPLWRRWSRPVKA
jgi:NAD(P)-dependent dehydrogenase (short-subunit alcohol dehydrogenase family)